MRIVYLVMVVAGLCLVAAGLRAIHYRSGAAQKWGALLAPVGLLVALLGALLLCVPGFFSFE